VFAKEREEKKGERGREDETFFLCEYATFNDRAE